MYKKQLEQNALGDVLIGLGSVIVIIALQKIVFFVNPNFLSSFIKITIDEALCTNIIVTQYTITFLIVSLLSLLSGSGEYIYWVDILEQKMISPSHLNFTSLSIYAFISMFVGTIAFMMNEVELVLIFFVVDVTLLVFLTFRMTSVYFGKERLRRSLHKKMMTEVKNYLEEPSDKKLQSIEEKLNGVYENATRLAEKKEFGAVLDTDFQLLIDLSELMNGIYDNDLAKILYGNVSKILLVFKDNSDYILNRLNEMYSPFSNYTLQKHTIEMIQSGLTGYFERILVDGKYQISQSYWISGIYQNLTKSYFQLKEAKDVTTLLMDSSVEYYNYEGELLLHKEKGEIDKYDTTLEEMKYQLVYEKLLRFCRLMYKNSPELFFKAVKEYNMPFVVMQELDLFGLICDNDSLEVAKFAYRRIMDKMYIFNLNYYLDTYLDIDRTYQISLANGDECYPQRLKEAIKNNSYKINLYYKEMLYEAAFVKKSHRVTKYLLCDMERNLTSIRETIKGEPMFSADTVQESIPYNPITGHPLIFRMMEKKERYPLLFNEENSDSVVYAVQIKDAAFQKMLISIVDTYAENYELKELANCLLKLFEQENNILEFMQKKEDAHMEYRGMKIDEMKIEYPYFSV